MTEGSLWVGTADAIRTMPDQNKDVICSARNCCLHFCVTLLAAVFAGNQRVLLGREYHDTCAKAFHTGDVAFSSPAIFAGGLKNTCGSHRQALSSNSIEMSLINVTRRSSRRRTFLAIPRLISACLFCVVDLYYRQFLSSLQKEEAPCKRWTRQKES